MLGTKGWMGISTSDNEGALEARNSPSSPGHNNSHATFQEPIASRSDK